MPPRNDGSLQRHFAAAETYDRAGFGERARRHRERARLFTRFGADAAHAVHAGEVRDAKALADRLTCMITMQLLVDPVVVSSGHTFERHAIERWIRAHGTCPVSRKRIGAEFVDNWAVRSLVSAFVEIYGARAGHEWAEIRALCTNYTDAKRAAEAAPHADRLLDDLDAPLRDEWAIEAFLLVVHQRVNIGRLVVGSGRTPSGRLGRRVGELSRGAEPRAVTKRVAFEAYKHSSWSWPEEVE